MVLFVKELGQTPVILRRGWSDHHSVSCHLRFFVSDFLGMKFAADSSPIPRVFQHYRRYLLGCGFTVGFDFRWRWNLELQFDEWSHSLARFPPDYQLSSPSCGTSEFREF